MDLSQDGVRRWQVDTLDIVGMSLGPAMTNTYLLGSTGGDTAVVVDPAWDGERIAAEAERQGWRISFIWLTHAHFDHFGGSAGLDAASPNPIPVALHPADQPLWRFNGGASLFGVEGFDPGPEPEIPFEHGQMLRLDDHIFEVRHTPGHTPGHVILVERRLGVTFCGDLIFMDGVGRVDLPGGSWETLLNSIHQEVLTLPDDMRLFPGHGPDTTVGRERAHNPWLS